MKKMHKATLAEKLHPGGGTDYVLYRQRRTGSRHGRQCFLAHICLMVFPTCLREA